MYRTRLNIIIASILLSLTAGLSAYSQTDSLTVSLLTCDPGRDVYELCGHAAVRIRGPQFDSVWNYGMFDFRSPNFIYRFVKGETDYMLIGHPTSFFPGEYISTGRKIIEQDLNLSQDEVCRLRALLQTEALPQNRVYRYNYVKDNCATRIVDRIQEAADTISFPQKSDFGTFRNEMRWHHRNYPWYQFGIDLALGSGLDYQLKSDEEMFVPMVMADRFREARMADGRPLVKAERVIYPGAEGASLPATPWYLTPLFWAWIAFAIVVVVACWQWRIHKAFPLVYSLWFGLCGVAALLIAFLVFVSTHEASSPNMLIWWLNPVTIVPAVTVWVRKCRTFNAWLLAAFAVLTALLLLAWYWLPQSTNPAFFPLMGITIILAGEYAILYLKKNE